METPKASHDGADLSGTWRVVSASFETADTGEVGDLYGSDPRRYLTRLTLR